MQKAIGPLVRFFTRNIYKTIETRFSWYEPLFINFETKNELQFWNENIKNYNGYTFKPYPTTAKVIFTDASEKGYGGFICERLSKKLCVGQFTNKEISESSTTRELLAVKYVLQSFGHLLVNEAIKVHIDNLNASRILSIGSSKSHLQKIAVDIFCLCLKRNIKLTSQWIPREENIESDELSKYNDTDDWGIDFHSFNYLNKKYGPYSIDRFASNRNNKTKKFNSKFYCPNSAAVDAFTVDWSGENNWICPPISIIGSVLRHMRLCKCKGTLLIPVWKSAYFWPLIYPNGIHLANFVLDFTILEPYFINYSESSIFSGYMNFKTIALYISFE